MESFFYSLAAGTALFLSFLTFTNPRKVNVLGNRWMALFLVSLFFLFVGESLFTFKIYQNYPNILGAESLLIFITSPALFMSVSHYISLDKKIKKIEYLHFLPALFFNALIVYTMITETRAEKIEIINSNNDEYFFPVDFLTYIIIFQMFFYVVYSYYKIVKHQKNINLFASNTSEIDLNWLKYTILGTLLMLLLWIIEIHFQNKITGFVSSAGYLIAIYVMGYYVFKQEEIFPFKDAEKEDIKEIIEDMPTSKSQRISISELEEKKEKLSEIMTTEKLYLDETLSLPKLASKIGISIHNLSYVLNEGFQENFFQFVNRFRIEEAKRLLTSERYQQLSMLGIAYESGFSSKTTFNTTFKKLTGISPSEYISQAENNTVSA